MTNDELARELRDLMTALPDIVRDRKTGSGEDGDHHDGEGIAREVERRLWDLVVRVEVP